MVKIYAIILNWNGFADTNECIESIRKIDTKDFKLNIVVVDNGSTDNSITELQGLQDKIKNFEIITNRKNLGFSGGMNVGISHALSKKADFILVLNNDIVVDKYFLSELLKTSKKYQNIGIAVPKIYFAPGFEFHKDRYKKKDLGKVMWYAGGVIDWKNLYGTNRGVDEVDNGKYQREEDTDFATGNCMLINSKALVDAGKFKEDYYLYLEDLELSVRFAKKGWRVIYSPKALIWHKVSQSSGIGSELNDYYTTRNRLLFGIKYAPIRTRIALLRESKRLLLKGRKWQRKGIVDFYLGKFGRGSWK